MGNTNSNNANKYIINDDGVSIIQYGNKRMSVGDKGIKMKNGNDLLTVNQDGICMRNGNSGIELTNENISMKNGNHKLLLSKDGICMQSGSDKLKVNKQGLYVNKVPQKIRTPSKSLVCFDESCVEFECSDRVKVVNNNIFCGEKVYYEFVNNGFVNKNE